MFLQMWVYKGVVKIAEYNFEQRRTSVRVVGTVKELPHFRQFEQGRK